MIAFIILVLTLNITRNYFHESPLNTFTTVFMIILTSTYASIDFIAKIREATRK